MLPLRSLVVLCAIGVVAAAAPDTSGKLSIYMAGKPAASETYTIQNADGKITIDGSGSADLGMLKINIEQFKVVTDEKYNPLSATAKAQMGRAKMYVNATFAGDQAKSQIDMGQGPTDKDDPIHGGDLIINANLPIFPWSLLMQRVSLSSDEPQQFYAYILGQGEAPITVISKGKEKVEFDAKTVTLNHVSGSMSLPSGQNINADFWINDDRKIIKMAVPSQSVEVYQDGFEPKPKPPKQPQ